VRACSLRPSLTSRARMHQAVDATLRVAVARHKTPQPFSRTASLSEQQADVAEAAARDSAE
jgi:hypothetical protein